MPINVLSNPKLCSQCHYESYIFWHLTQKHTNHTLIYTEITQHQVVKVVSGYQKNTIALSKLMSSYV